MEQRIWASAGKDMPSATGRRAWPNLECGKDGRYCWLASPLLLRDLEKEVERAQESATGQTAAAVTIGTQEEAQDVLRVSSTNARAALLLLASKIEERIRKSLAGSGLDTNRPFMPLMRMVEQGVREHALPEEVLPALRDFWQLRNRVGHGDALDVPDSMVMSLISLRLEILKIIPVSRAGE
jgi:hypothetical protein